MADEPSPRLENRRDLMEARRLETAPRAGGPANLADILERVLDKGIVIAGDIQINLLDIELLTIKLRLLVASVERAQEMGINWWESDPALTSNGKELKEENEELRDRLDRLEQLLVAALPAGDEVIEEHREEHEVVRDERGNVVEERHHEEHEEPSGG
jgi:hypothetical protein